ncbi:YjfA family protein [Shimazuella sp. AN120528]|uniref:DUF2690 domain-containing protein n=1 Tax=Shimazuella soli TaxID=1892854 RepID=UPI001F10FB97|nr:DUF2690 domain-containing protein [Shimazuella soli]MCH5585017.1 YjfA family protein [Shimazuella soli]
MRLKKWHVGFLSAVVGVAALFVGISDTSAAFDGKKKYDGKSPVATHCDDTGVAKKTKSFSYKGVKGKIYLMYSTKCKTAWGYVKLNKPLPSNSEVYGWVHRNNERKVYYCSSKGGNGAIQPGQTTCYSPMVYDYKPNTSNAGAVFYSPKGDYEHPHELGYTDSY